MPSSLTSLFWISLCAVIAPLVAGSVPRRWVPEVVLLLLGGGFRPRLRARRVRRRIHPAPRPARRSERLESKLDGLAFGFLIPVFFVTSGMPINPAAVASQTADLVIFIALILLLRGGPVYLASRFDRSSTSAMGPRDSVRVALYASTGLPIIVAVTSLAVGDGQMSSTNGAVLVAGGAVTVFLFPMLATVLGSARERLGSDAPP